VLDKLKVDFFNKQPQYDSHSTTKFHSISLIIVLFFGLFAAILISTSSPSFVYSLSNSTANNITIVNNTTKTDLTNKEIPDKVKQFI
jgi:hypothetical protein